MRLRLSVGFHTQPEQTPEAIRRKLILEISGLEPSEKVASK